MKKSDGKLVEIDSNNLEVFKNLAQPYEAEFSKLTHKMPDEFGLFKLDTLPFAPYTGYLFYHKETPVGFCIVNRETEIRDVSEFYVVPVMRGKKLGREFAFAMFNQYPGQWQVRQIEGADDAIHFWRAVIKKYTQGEYEESVIKDARWGVVTQQRFKNGRI